ncbi:unnamed protein product [Brassicogethes aeneus]|uniref:F-box domain-containing protein n=1 Tax=Brassicogethes aeneus TaxID=1431903 RepID=A0A9P0BDQ4_BRAAE|nr:unnamed protein product [Brassicogethes aeneus]
MEETSNESDSDNGYYLRSKRRKLSECSPKSKTRKHIDRNDAGKRKNPIMHLPTEILQNIFNFLPYHELNNRVRLVNHRFKIIAENELNVAFKVIETDLTNQIKKTYECLEGTRDDAEIKHICKKLNMLELVNIQHSIVTATIWRFVYNDYYRTPNTCMYGGLLLDFFKNFLLVFRSTPEQLYSPMIAKDYMLPVEITKIVIHAKLFCVHFDKVTEESRDSHIQNSGCKLLDLMECALFAQKTTIFEKITAETFTAKYCFFFNNTWFIALPITSTKEMSWRQKQRMMHMRLRRIVLSHSDMYLQQAQYEREVALRPEATERVKRPGNNVYTGYGDVEDQFFYYGVMNNGAYTQKFQTVHNDNDEEDDEHEDVDVVQVNNGNHGDFFRVANSSSENMLYRVPHLGLRIDVSVKCPIAYAPLRVLENALVKPNIKPKGTTEINMVFDCYGGYYPRLPTQCKYNFKPSKNM